MRINTNIAALNSYRALSLNEVNSQKSLEKLSSGFRINRAADDAAGLAISEKMRGQIRGLTQAQRNAQDGISLIQTAEGALNETHSILQRMRELAVQASNDTLSVDDRNEIQKEVNQLIQEIDRIASTTEFNTKKLLNGGAGLVTEFSVETVAGVTQDWISVLGGTVDTTADNTNITITGATKAAGAAQTITFTAAYGGGQVSINGITISFTAGADAAASAQNFKAAIDAVATSLGVTTSGNSATITITTTDVGSAAKLTILANTNVIDNAVYSTTSNGSDANIDSSKILDTAYIAQGNIITVTSGTYKGLQLQLNGSVMSGTAAQNVATFKITGNGVMAFQIGANQNQNMSVSISDMRAAALGVDNIIVTSRVNADAAVTSIDSAIKTVSAERSKLGAYQNRLEHTINNLGTAAENLTAAESRIRDVDMAQEMMSYTKNNILLQAATAMLAQANQQPQAVLQLLR